MQPLPPKVDSPRQIRLNSLTKEEMNERMRAHSSMAEDWQKSGGGSMSLQEVYVKVIGGIGWFHALASVILIAGYISGQYIGVMIGFLEL